MKKVMLTAVRDEQKSVHRSFKTHVRSDLEEMYNKCCKVPWRAGCLAVMDKIVRDEMKLRKEDIFTGIAGKAQDQLQRLIVCKYVPVSIT